MSEPAFVVMKIINFFNQLPIHVKIFLFVVAVTLLIASVGGLMSFLKGPIRERHITGVRLAHWKQLARKTAYRDKKARSRQILIGEVPWPADLENRHLLIAGTTGAGKSTLISQILPRLRDRGERAVVVDLNGDFAKQFFKKGDRIYNPFDAKSIRWNPLFEIKATNDIMTLLRAMVPTGTTPEDENWRGFARDLLKSLMMRLFETGELNMDRLRHYTVSAGDKEIAAFLQGGDNPTRLQDNSMVSTSKSVLKHFIEAWDPAPPESNFSVAEWVRNGAGFIFITPREDQRQALMPLVNTFMNIVVKGALSPAKGSSRKPIALVIDELSSFDFDDLQGVLEKGRKFRLVAYAGIQNVSQLRQKYGQDGAKVLMSCFSSKVVFNPGDADTADEMANELGHHVVERLKTSRTRTQKGGTTTTQSWHRSEPEPIVLSTNLRQLPPLHAYLKLTGDYPVAKITVPI